MHWLVDLCFRVEINVYVTGLVRATIWINDSSRNTTDFLVALNVFAVRVKCN